MNILLKEKFSLDKLDDYKEDWLYFGHGDILAGYIDFYLNSLYKYKFFDKEYERTVQIIYYICG